MEELSREQIEDIRENRLWSTVSQKLDRANANTNAVRRLLTSITEEFPVEALKKFSGISVPVPRFGHELPVPSQKEFRKGFCEGMLAIRNNLHELDKVKKELKKRGLHEVI